MMHRPALCTFHAYEEEVGGERPPVIFLLMGHDKAPVELQEISHYLLADCVIEWLLQVQSATHTAWFGHTSYKAYLQATCSAKLTIESRI